MLIFVDNWIFSSFEKENWQVPSFSLHSKRKSKRCGLRLPWRRDNSKTTQIQKVTEYHCHPLWTIKVFEAMFVLESKRKDKSKSWSFRPLATFIAPTWRHWFLALLTVYILRIRNNQDLFIANRYSLISCIKDKSIATCADVTRLLLLFEI